MGGLDVSQHFWAGTGPTSGADPRGIIFGIFAILCPLLTLTSRGIIILIFEVCIYDCPKSWSGLLAFAAARVLGWDSRYGCYTYVPRRSGGEQLSNGGRKSPAESSDEFCPVLSSHKCLPLLRS